MFVKIGSEEFIFYLLNIKLTKKKLVKRCIA